MSGIHDGGCVCGAVRYRVSGVPIRTSICHCTFCQRRTGSAFGFGAYLRQEDVAITRGTLTVYEHRSDESGRWLRMEFCPVCGTTVTWTVEALPGTRAIAGGTFDDPSWLKIERHGWLRSAHPWMIVPPDVERHAQSALPPPPQKVG